MACRRPKRGIELSLYVEDIEWMDRMGQERRLPSSRSEIVGQAIQLLRRSMASSLL